MRKSNKHLMYVFITVMICTLLLTLLSNIDKVQAATVTFYNGDTLTMRDSDIVKSTDYAGIHSDLYSNGLLVMTGTQTSTFTGNYSNISTTFSSGQCATVKYIYADFIIKDNSWFFRGFSNCEYIQFGDNFINSSSNLTSLNDTFSELPKLKVVDMSELNLVNVKSTNYMFNNTMSKGTAETLILPTTFSSGCNISYMFYNYYYNPVYYMYDYLTSSIDTSIKYAYGSNMDMLKESLLNATEPVIITTDTNFVYTKGTIYYRAGKANMLVKANVTDTYTVSIPAKVTLEKQGTDTYSKDFKIGAKGIISDDKSVSVSMTDVSHTLTSDEQNVVDLDVDIKDSIFNNNPGQNELYIGYDDFTYSAGNLSAVLTDVGRYTGSIGFNFSLK